MVLQRLGVHHHQILDLARYLARVEDLGRARLRFHFHELGIPGHDRGRVLRLERGHDVGVRGIDGLDVLLLELDARQSPREQVVRHGQLDDVDLLALDVGQRLALLEHHAVVAVGEVAHDDRAAVDPPCRGDRKRVHVGDGHAVELAGGVLVDRFDIIVDLRDIDLDAVFVAPLLDDSRVGGVGPRHPADIDRPGDVEFLLWRRPGRRAEARGDERRGQNSGRHACEWFHFATLVVHPM